MTNQTSRLRYANIIAVFENISTIIILTLPFLGVIS